MLVTTTSSLQDKRIIRYLGIVSGETIIGANVFRDFFAGIRDIVGGRSGSYEEVLRQAKDTALKEMQQQAMAMGANAVIGVDLDYENANFYASRKLDPSLTAVYVPCPQELLHVSSSIVRNSLTFGTPYDEYVTAEVKAFLQTRK